MASALGHRHSHGGRHLGSLVLVLGHRHLVLGERHGGHHRGARGWLHEELGLRLLGSLDHILSVAPAAARVVASTLVGRLETHTTCVHHVVVVARAGAHLVRIESMVVLVGVSPLRHSLPCRSWLEALTRRIHALSLRHLEVVIGWLGLEEWGSVRCFGEVGCEVLHRGVHLWGPSVLARLEIG